MKLELLKLRWCLKGFLLLLICFSVTETRAQFDNDFQAGAYNIAFGGILGGIGALINKTPDQTTGQAFWKGAKHGALGGYLMFEGKRLVREFARSGNYAYLWPAKVVHAAGSSIVENAAANQPFGTQWNLHFGFNRIEYHPFEKQKLRYKIMLYSLVNSVYFSKYGKFDLKKTLRTGTLIFTGNGSFRNLSAYDDYDPDALAGVNTILLKGWASKETVAHELIHTYQFESTNSLNTYLNKPFARWEQNRFFATYQKYVYTELGTEVHFFIYSTFKQHETNFFEREAGFYDEL